MLAALLLLFQATTADIENAAATAPVFECTAVFNEGRRLRDWLCVEGEKRSNCRTIWIGRDEVALSCGEDPTEIARIDGMLSFEAPAPPDRRIVCGPYEGRRRDPDWTCTYADRRIACEDEGDQYGYGPRPRAVRCASEWRDERRNRRLQEGWARDTGPY